MCIVCNRVRAIVGLVDQYLLHVYEEGHQNHSLRLSYIVLNECVCSRLSQYALLTIHLSFCALTHLTANSGDLFCMVKRSLSILLTPLLFLFDHSGSLEVLFILPRRP